MKSDDLNLQWCIEKAQFDALKKSAISNESRDKMRDVNDYSSFLEEFEVVLNTDKKKCYSKNFTI